MPKREFIEQSAKNAIRLARKRLGAAKHVEQMQHSTLLANIECCIEATNTAAQFADTNFSKASNRFFSVSLPSVG